MAGAELPVQVLITELNLFVHRVLDCVELLPQRKLGIRRVHRPELLGLPTGCRLIADERRRDYARTSGFLWPVDSWCSDCIDAVSLEVDIGRLDALMGFLRVITATA